MSKQVWTRTALAVFLLLGSVSYAQAQAGNSVPAPRAEQVRPAPMSGRIGQDPAAVALRPVGAKPADAHAPMATSTATQVPPPANPDEPLLPTKSEPGTRRQHVDTAKDVGKHADHTQGVKKSNETKSRKLNRKTSGKPHDAARKRPGKPHEAVKGPVGVDKLKRAGKVGAHHQPAKGAPIRKVRQSAKPGKPGKGDQALAQQARPSAKGEKARVSAPHAKAHAASGTPRANKKPMTGPASATGKGASMHKAKAQHAPAAPHASTPQGGGA